MYNLTIFLITKLSIYHYRITMNELCSINSMLALHNTPIKSSIVKQYYFTSLVVTNKAPIVFTRRDLTGRLTRLTQNLQFLVEKEHHHLLISLFVSKRTFSFCCRRRWDRAQANSHLLSQQLGGVKVESTRSWSVFLRKLKY